MDNKSNEKQLQILIVYFSQHTIKNTLILDVKKKSDQGGKGSDRKVFRLDFESD